MLHGYARVSTDTQDNSLEAQQERILAYANSSGVEFGELFVDRDQSAYRIPLHRRREGKRLCDRLNRGDTVVFTKIDRCFRSLQDQVSTLGKWDDMGIGYSILDLPIQLQSPYGRCTLGILGTVSQLSSELTGVRVREVVAYLRSQGRPYGGGRPLGWVKVAGEYHPCPKERETARQVAQMRSQGESWATITLAVCKAGTRKPQSRANSRGWYSISDVRRLHWAAEAGFPKLPPRSVLIEQPADSPVSAASHADPRASGA